MKVMNGPSPCEANIVQGQIKDRSSDGANVELYLPPRAPPPHHVAQLLQMTVLYARVKHRCYVVVWAQHCTHTKCRLPASVLYLHGELKHV
jgi:hypothetical protein